MTSSRNQQIAGEFTSAHDVVRKAIVDLTEDQTSAAGPDGWSIKDHLAHLTHWREMRFFEIHRIARGGEPSVPLSTEEQVTSLNEAVVAFRRGLSFRQVVADLEFAWSMVEQAVATCPADRLEHSFSGEMGPFGTGHDISHAQMIRALRQG
jgi:hypothetical protein